MMIDVYHLVNFRKKEKIISICAAFLVFSLFHTEKLLFFISIPSQLFLPSEACLVCFFCCVFRCCVAFSGFIRTCVITTSNVLGASGSNKFQLFRKRKIIVPFSVFKCILTISMSNRNSKIKHT